MLFLFALQYSLARCWPSTYSMWPVAWVQESGQDKHSGDSPAASFYVIFSSRKLNSGHNVLFILCPLPEVLAYLIKMSVWMQNTRFTDPAQGGEKSKQASQPGGHCSLQVFSWPLEELLSFPIKSCLNLMIFTHRHYRDQKPDYVSGVIESDMPVFLLGARPAESWWQMLKVWLWMRPSAPQNTGGWLVDYVAPI